MFCGSSLTENSMEYLKNLSRNLPLTQSSIILQSYYSTKVRRLTLNRSGVLNTKASKQCVRCCISFSEKLPSYKIQPERKRSKFVEKLLRKSREDERLTHYQIKYLNNLKKKGNTIQHNTLVVKCNICGKEVREKLPKLDRKEKIDPITPKTLQKKRKRKKDIFVGLNKEAILASTPNKLYPTDDVRVTTNVSTVNVENPKLGTKKRPEHISKNTFKQTKKNRKNITDLNNILNTRRESSSNKLKQFLTTI